LMRQRARVMPQAGPDVAAPSQVWRGALLLVDWAVWRAPALRGATVLELGAGTGLAGIEGFVAGKGSGHNIFQIFCFLVLCIHSVGVMVY